MPNPNWKIITTTSVLLSAGTIAQAQPLSCGQTHVVNAGDTLSKLAAAAYGDPADYTFIYRANSREIGDNPGAIQIGQELFIPCLDSALVPSSADQSAISDQTVTAALPAPGSDREIRVLTATGWAPYMDEDQAQGGMLTELMNLALANAPGSPAYKIDFINDDGAHLNPLIVDHAYDISIGWSEPNCDNQANMADESLFRCNNLLFSDPLYEEVLGYYSTVDLAQISEHQGLLGRRICRTEAYTLAPLEDYGLQEPDIEIVRAPTSETCIDYILDGTADIALVASDVASGRLSELGKEDQVHLHEALTYVDVLHAVTAKTNPDAEEILAYVNDGLDEIKTSGLWFQTVRRHLAEFRAQSN